MKQVEKITNVYEDGAITGYEAAGLVAKAITEENADECVAAIKHFPHFRKEVAELVERFGNLTDEQWDSMRTFGIVANTRPVSDEEHRAEEREYHESLRRGIEILKRYNLAQED